MTSPFWSIVLGLMLRHVPPGETYFSVEPRPDCGTDPTHATCELLPVCKKASLLCAPPRWSTYYSAWVQTETAETGRERYEPIARNLAEVALRLLCLRQDADGTMSRSPDCVPIRWGYSRFTKKNTGTARELVMSTLGSLIPESGSREDVEVGRGRYKHPVDGGQGRGPAGEVGLMQINPVIAWAFSPSASDEDRKLAAHGDRAARERIAAALLGRDDFALEAMFETGMTMLAHSREWCEEGNPTKQWAYRMFSYQGTGTSCDSANDGKTNVRVRMLYLLMHNRGPDPELAHANTLVPRDKPKPPIPGMPRFEEIKKDVQQHGAMNQHWKGQPKPKSPSPD